MAIDTGRGGQAGFEWVAGVTSGVGDQGAALDVSPLSGTSKVLADLASYVGTDPAWARGAGITADGFTVSAEEDWSADNETSHTQEDVSWFAFDGIGTAAQADYRPFMEIGEILLNHQATTLTLENSYDDPVVVAFVASTRGKQAVTARIDNVSEDSLTIRLQEPNHLDGSHLFETVRYMVIDAGSYRLADGTLIEAGLTDISKLTSDRFTDVQFDSHFDDAPAVFSQVQTSNGSDFVTMRQMGSTIEGVSLALQEEEALNDGAHLSETVGWIAMELGDGAADGCEWSVG